MDEAVKQIVTQAPIPALAVFAIVYVVRLFLAEIRANQSLVRDLHAESMAAREQSRIVIDNNTRGMAENTAAMRDLKDAVEHIKLT